MMILRSLCRRRFSCTLYSRNGHDLSPNFSSKIALDKRDPVPTLVSLRQWKKYLNGLRPDECTAEAHKIFKLAHLKHFSTLDMLDLHDQISDDLQSHSATLSIGSYRLVLQKCLDLCEGDNGDAFSAHEALGIVQEMLRNQMDIMPVINLLIPILAHCEHWDALGLCRRKCPSDHRLLFLRAYALKPDSVVVEDLFGKMSPNERLEAMPALALMYARMGSTEKAQDYAEEVIRHSLYDRSVARGYQAQLLSLESILQQYDSTLGKFLPWTKPLTDFTADRLVAETVKNSFNLVTAARSRNLKHESRILESHLELLTKCALLSPTVLSPTQVENILKRYISDGLKPTARLINTVISSFALQKRNYQDIEPEAFKESMRILTWMNTLGVSATPESFKYLFYAMYKGTPDGDRVEFENDIKMYVRTAEPECKGVSHPNLLSSSLRSVLRTMESQRIPFSQDSLKALLTVSAIGARFPYVMSVLSSRAQWALEGDQMFTGNNLTNGRQCIQPMRTTFEDIHAALDCFKIIGMNVAPSVFWQSALPLYPRISKATEEKPVDRIEDWLGAYHLSSRQDTVCSTAKDLGPSAFTKLVQIADRTGDVPGVYRIYHELKMKHDSVTWMSMPAMKSLIRMARHLPMSADEPSPSEQLTRHTVDHVPTVDEWLQQLIEDMETFNLRPQRQIYESLCFAYAGLGRKSAQVQHKRSAVIEALIDEWERFSNKSATEKMRFYLAKSKTIVP